MEADQAKEWARLRAISEAEQSKPETIRNARKVGLEWASIADALRMSRAQVINLSKK